MRAMFASIVPMGRMGDADETAKAALYRTTGTCTLGSLCR